MKPVISMQEFLRLMEKICLKKTFNVVTTQSDPHAFACDQLVLQCSVAFVFIYHPKKKVQLLLLMIKFASTQDTHSHPFRTASDPGWTCEN